MSLVKFIREVQAQGLYVSLRIGPFVESEWKYGYEIMICWEEFHFFGVLNIQIFTQSFIHAEPCHFGYVVSQTLPSEAIMNPSRYNATKGSTSTMYP